MAPAGPRGAPFVGVFPIFARDPLGFLSRMARTYGDVVEYSFMGRPVVQLNHPDDMESLLVGAQKHLMKDEVTRALSLILGEGLITSEGAHWKRQRKLAAPSFTRRHVDGYGEGMVTLCEAWTAALPIGGVVDVHHEVLSLTRDIVLVCLFGSSAGPGQDIAGAIDVFMQEFQTEAQGWRRVLPRSVWTPGRARIAGARAEIDRVVAGFIRDAEQRGEGDDVICRLLAARDDDDQPMSAEHLRDEVVTFFTAGHETTAIALTHICDQLARNPRVRSALEEELRRVLAGRTPTVEALSDLPYTRALVKEVLRLLPPVWAMGREATAPVEVAGHRFDIGTNFFLAQWVVHHDERWFDAPLALRPERWLDPNFKPPRLAWSPFGGGSRICIGNHFALMELQLAVATLAQQVRFEHVDWRPLRLEPSVTLRPRDPVRMRVVSR